MVGGNNGGWDGNDDMSAHNGLDANWHFWTGTYNSITGYRALYIDGNLVVYETSNRPYISATASHVTINCEDSGNGSYSFNNYYAFEFYDMRIYNYELSPDQVMYLYTNLPPGTPAQIGQQPPASISTTFGSNSADQCPNRWQRSPDQSMAVERHQFGGRQLLAASSSAAQVRAP